MSDVSDPMLRPTSPPAGEGADPRGAIEGASPRSPWAHDAAQRDRIADELPPLEDPYLGPRATQPAAAPELSVLAVGSVVAALALGPVGAVAAIFFGWAARREIDREPSRGRGHALATLGMALGVVLTMVWAAGATLGVWVWQQRAVTGAVSAPPAPEAQPAPASTGAPSPGAHGPPAGVAPGGSVPQRTTLRRVGALEVVDVGIDAATLGEALATQRAEAHAVGEKLLVMTTRDPCDPCRGVDASLTDPLMQTALRGVRLVRVDIDVFKDDLDQLRMPRQEYPGFFLLSPDLTPGDGINGGEWGEDIARNIAPVLGAFVRGHYRSRRQPWRPLPGIGIRL